MEGVFIYVLRVFSYSEDEKREHRNNDTIIYFYCDLSSISLMFNRN
jgi:hypothetical protein